MALTIGAVTIDPLTGAETKSGMVQTIYDQLKAQLGQQVDPSNIPMVIAAREGFARLATALAGSLYTILTVDAQAKISTSDGALQRDPSTLASTLAPTSDQFLSIV